MATHLNYDTDKRVMYVTTAPSGGVLSLDIRQDIYSDVKDDWKNNAALNKFKFPFRTSGGDTIIPNEKYIGNYVFLQNGWSMRPYEADHALYLNNGYLLVEGGGEPWLPCLGDYTVNIKDSIPADAIAIETGTSGLTQDESNALLSIESDQAQIASDIGTINTNISAIQVDLSNMDTIQGNLEAMLMRALGLMQENYEMTQCQYVEYQGQRLLTYARVRLYNTEDTAQWDDQHLVAQYDVNSQWTGQDLVQYRVNRVMATTTTTTTTSTTTTL